MLLAPKFVEVPCAPVQEQILAGGGCVARTRTVRTPLRTLRECGSTSVTHWASRRNCTISHSSNAEGSPCTKKVSPMVRPEAAHALS
eukprot:2700546-Amphidinium_carterae.1